MHRIRVIIAIVLALLWVPSSGHCLLAATFPDAFATCCECDGDAGNGHEAPFDEGTCNQCVTLETGVNLGALLPVALPSPEFWEEDALARWLRRAVELAAREVAEVPRAVPMWSPPPMRTVTLTKARPVRGPSLAA